MESEKTHTTDKKKLLYQLESIVKSLYPHKRIHNPYQEYLQSYYQDLPIEDVLLFKRLLRSVTLINHKERIYEKDRYLCSYADVLTTIELISRHTINDVLLSSFVELKTVFRDGSFTKLQASRVLRKSIRTVEHYMKLWLQLHLAENTGIRRGRKNTYRLLGYRLAE